MRYDSIDSCMALHLECEEEELSECQKQAFDAATKQYSAAVDFLNSIRGVTVVTSASTVTPNNSLRKNTALGVSKQNGAYVIPVSSSGVTKSLASNVSSSKNESVSLSPKVSVKVLNGNFSREKLKEASQSAKDVPYADTPHQVYINVAHSPPLPTNLAPILKSHPLLITTPKPQNLAPPNVSGQKRTDLDASVKSLLMMTPAGQVEWLLRLSLLRLKNVCEGAGGSVKLAKVTGGPQQEVNGGYVWVCECCPEKYGSVFSGSIFECVNLPPSKIVKLIYHWACQTAVPNVVQWVQTDLATIERFYGYIRALCIWKLKEDISRVGGSNRVVEVGLITLGKRVGDSKRRLVDILGLYDNVSKRYIVRAHQVGQYGSQENLSHLLEALPSLVRPRTVFVVDNTINKDWLRGIAPSYNFTVVESCGEGIASNRNIMTYLTKVVPPLFQYNLEELKVKDVHSFLGELCWRELWGTMAADAFNNILDHLGTFTRSCAEGSNMKTRLEDLLNGVQVKENKAAVARYTIENLVGVLSMGTSGRQGVKRPSNGTSSVSKRANLQPSNAKMVPLESFYYGHLPGRAMFDEAYTGVFKCHVCVKVINNNIQFMKHLYLHLESARSYSTDLSDLTQCKYCFQSFGTPFVMQTHVEEIHLRTKSKNYCKICNEVYQDRIRLQTHMASTHVELEMPYICEICEFRSSIHRDVLEHFQQVHNGSDKVLCHICLKVMKANPSLHFFSHIQRHQLKRKDNLRLKCRNCCLHFHIDSRLKSHAAKDHISMKGLPGVKHYELDPNEEPTLIPKPNTVFNTKRREKSKAATVITRDLFYKMKALDVDFNVTEVSKCKECHIQITDVNHYNSVWGCAQCPYITCCIKAMTDHCATMHIPVPSFNIGWAIILPSPMFCICGFCTKSGNRMAGHLVSCDKRSCYPSMEAANQATFKAQSATFPPLVTLDDNEGGGEDPNNTWIKAFHSSREKDISEKKSEPDPADSGISRGKAHAPSVLNMLGLVRKQSSEDDEEDSAEQKTKDEEKMEVDESSRDPASANDTDVCVIESSESRDQTRDVSMDESNDDVVLIDDDRPENSSQLTADDSNDKDNGTAAIGPTNREDLVSSGSEYIKLVDVSDVRTVSDSGEAEQENSSKRDEDKLGNEDPISLEVDLAGEEKKFSPKESRENVILDDDADDSLSCQKDITPDSDMKEYPTSPIHVSMDSDAEDHPKSPKDTITDSDPKGSTSSESDVKELPNSTDIAIGEDAKGLRKPSEDIIIGEDVKELQLSPKDIAVDENAKDLPKSPKNLYTTDMDIKDNAAPPKHVTSHGDNINGSPGDSIPGAASAFADVGEKCAEIVEVITDVSDVKNESEMKSDLPDERPGDVPSSKDTIKSATEVFSAKDDALSRKSHTDDGMGSGLPTETEVKDEAHLEDKSEEVNSDSVSRGQSTSEVGDEDKKENLGSQPGLI